VLERMRLGKQADRLPSQITLADRKKVEIGRAIAGNCRVLLLDESLSGLTHDEAEELIVEIMALNRASGITVWWWSMSCRCWRRWCSASWCCTTPR